MPWPSIVHSFSNNVGFNSKSMVFMRRSIEAERFPLVDKDSNKLKGRFQMGVVTRLSSWNFLRRKSDEFVDRKSTRLNSSHDQISYAVFCLKKKKQKQTR